MNLNDTINKAEAHFHNNDYDAAAKMYVALRQYAHFAPICDYRLAAIANNTGDPLTAYDLYYKAFTAKNDIASILYPKDIHIHEYIYKGMKDEKETIMCPLCGNLDAQPKWCYPLSEAYGYNDFFNPIRLWMYCEPCHHIFARHFPERLFLYNDNPRSPNIAFLHYYSSVFNRVSQYATGRSLLEVGIGACECMLAAREMGYNSFGIDVIEKHVIMAREKFGMNAQTADFVEFQTDERYDVIIMGDVIEHVSDPIKAMRNAHDLLTDEGAVWISTPNFDSAYSIVTGHSDAMKRQQYHLNYFSRDSFFMLLGMCDLVPVEYNISSHYNGSMEVIAVKSNRINA